MTDIVFIQIGQYETSPRLIKEYTTLSKHYKCKMLLWNISEVPLPSNNDTYYFNFNPPQGLKRRLSFFKWMFFCFHLLSILKPRVLHAVDLDGVMIALLYRCFHPSLSIICDINDPTADRYAFKEGSIIRKCILMWERFLILKTNTIILTAPTVMKQLNLNASMFKGSIAVIYNSQDLSSLHDILKINLKGKIIRLVYVGMLHRNIRGLEMLINAAKKLPFIQLTIAGFGPDEKYFYQLQHVRNVKITHRISYERVPKLCSIHDMVVSLLDPTFQNYKYALSSKIFDAFASMRPVITTDNTASSDLINKTCWGSTIPYDEKKLVNLLSNIYNGKITYELNPRNIQEYNWDHSGKKLIQIYRTLLNK